MVLGCSGPKKTGSSSIAGVRAVQGWLSWRGPQQNGTSLETNLPGKIDKPLWTKELHGRGTPVIAGDRIYSWGYDGEGADLQEVLACLEADTGKVIWEERFADFISDIIYDRYSIGSPTIDPETGNVYFMTTAGLFHCFTSDGDLLWHVSMMEQFGRLTFPNGRTGAPTISEDLVIVRGVTTNWGVQGPPRDRFYAFDKLSGQPVWASAPGPGPPFLKDSSFSHPILADYLGQRVFYAGIGSGNTVCVNVRTGKPIWRFQMSVGGVNSTPVLHNGNVIAIHGRENLDSSKIGRMVAIKQPTEMPDKLVLLNEKSSRDNELWRNELGIFTSSPVIVGDRVYQVIHTGELHCVDANTGKSIWHKKLGNGQLHASPTYADGKLYVPMVSGEFYVLKLNDDGAEELTKMKLEGSCLGAPAVWNGKVYVHTTAKLYCFGSAGSNPGLPASVEFDAPFSANPAVALRVYPPEVLLRPGGKQTFRIVGIDAAGVEVPVAGKPVWEKYIPPTAKVRVKLDAEFNEAGELVANPKAVYSAGAFRVKIGDLTGIIRGRILPRPPFKEDFEGFTPNVDHKTEGVKFSYPPLPWIGARFKWDIREREGNKVLAKTLDRLLFQRSTTYIGASDMTGYTIAADVLTDGNRRVMGSIGLVCQRYNIVLKGNHQQLEINSNHERIKENVPFRWKAKTWYTLKARVDLNDDGSGVVHAKAWPKDSAEPDAWTIEVKHGNAHKEGSPGIFGFAPQNKVRVYVDNIKVTPTK